MCRWRHVNNIYLRCGHVEELIRCESTHCKFSSNHPRSCVPPYCSRTCNQYHLFPERYVPEINGFCSACTSAMSSRSRR
ncbi:hypothetical protein GGX14DRAFT_450299 [Mycena pura]|uniref:Uncharacterized protein n=1 Tax=Mycena pura TaxID=153505 RepID=A0AAD6VM82_9AGAR|nr:hypothetical protein GGX14DRAFT_450299 [Mycena pura]